MFGHIQANLSDLTQEEKERYRSAYCGLCHTLGNRYGFQSRLGLTYDLTFLAMLLSSLYEPRESNETARCVVHPCKKHDYTFNECTEYAADMTIALMYYKCLDDWNDDRNILHKCYASLLKKAYTEVQVKRPEQCFIIEKELKKISEIEAKRDASPDAAANCFGRLMAGIFVMEQDHWTPYLQKFGYFLGKYIYLADAAVDLRCDKRRGSYNPLVNLSQELEEIRPMLKNILGEASESFEALPLVQDISILRNILYSGIWIKYNRQMQVERKKSESW